VGLAFNPETTVEDALAASADADLVLCMSIHPGYSGQEFMPEAVERIRTLHSGLDGRAVVQVDGGIGAENARTVREAGATAIVAGSSIFAGPDPSAAYRRLRALVE
jgi:ribulose-phosphate 3-epimerase